MPWNKNKKDQKLIYSTELRLKKYIFLRKLRLNLNIKCNNIFIITVLAYTYSIGQIIFSCFMPWNNYQGIRVYTKTVKYTNIIAFNILIQSKFPQRMDFYFI